MTGHGRRIRWALSAAALLVGCAAPPPVSAPGAPGLPPEVDRFRAELADPAKHPLRTGDLVFVDIGFAVDGYHTDKTMVYMFGGPLPDEAIAIHRRCVEVQHQLASLIKPGAIPSDIYTTVMNGLDPEFLQNFMGFGDRRANFLGHGVGLQIDELPVIAEGFDEPLVEGMVLALEPKKGIAGVGMVGIEDTFIVTPEGGRSITGTNPGLILVKG